MANSNAYMKEYMSKRRAERRQKLREMLGDKCARCPYNGPDLDFDHVVPGSKSFQLSGRGLDKNWDKILEELAKCQLLCKPCHSRKTVECGESGGGHNKNQDPYVHGTVRTYTETNCRCGPCKEAKKLYRAKEVTYQESVIK